MIISYYGSGQMKLDDFKLMKIVVGEKIKHISPDNQTQRWLCFSTRLPEGMEEYFLYKYSISHIDFALEILQGKYDDF
jgi:hypothetical protein